MSVQERIRKIADELFNGNISAFCRAVDVKQPTMNTILGERQSKPSYDVLSSIVNAEALNIYLLNGFLLVRVKCSNHHRQKKN